VVFNQTTPDGKCALPYIYVHLHIHTHMYTYIQICPYIGPIHTHTHTYICLYIGNGALPITPKHIYTYMYEIQTYIHLFIYTFISLHR
jgi:hypothetical protein